MLVFGTPIIPVLKRLIALLAFIPGVHATEVVSDDLVLPSHTVEGVNSSQFADYNIVTLASGGDLEARTLAALIEAEPRTVIELPSGTYNFTGELSVSVDNIVIRGQGSDADDGTVLRFAHQTKGVQGIFATGDNFVVEDLAIEDAPGDAINVMHADGVTLRNLRIEWTDGPNERNGAYGLYPVQSRNVLIEDCEVRGARDAGIYVGQSERIIVRRNLVYDNVAGIEIENSAFADVYDNSVKGNSAGILIFNVFGPPKLGSVATRVFNNRIDNNNEPNFSPKGALVNEVPSGTGLMLMASDKVEVFDNTITGNQSAAILIASYYIHDIHVSGRNYDPVPKAIHIHDNEFGQNGSNPQGIGKAIKKNVFGDDSVDIFYDNSGVGTHFGLQGEFPEGLPAEQAICISHNTPDITMGQANLSLKFGGPTQAWRVSTDPEFFNCAHDRLPPVELEPPVNPEKLDSGHNPVELCGATDHEDKSAYLADCPTLSDYGLFSDPSNPLSEPNGGIPYDLNTPLFTDYTDKYRFVFLPKSAQAKYQDRSVFEFPVGTIIAKTFALRQDLRDVNSPQEIIETRLLIHRDNGWVALPYVWNRKQSEAKLVRVGGTRAVNWIDARGDLQMTSYVIPNVNDCMSCHGKEPLRPIGPTARSLNKRFPYPEGPKNQLAHWAEQGILRGLPSDTTAIPTMPVWNDPAVGLDKRARAYLDVNCAHCHWPQGAASRSGLFLEFDRPLSMDVGVCKRPVAAGRGGEDLRYDIVPGDAGASILPFRMASNAPDVRMPEIGRSVVDRAGVDLMRDWINAMIPEDCASE